MSEIQTPFSQLKNKTGKHKDWYGSEFVEIFCNELVAQKASFDHSDFLKEFKKSYKKMELKERLDLIASLIEEHIEVSYEKKLKIFEKMLGEPWPNEEGMFNYGFFLYPISQYVEKHAMQNPAKSFAFLEKLTMRFTSEWAIRPLANAFPKETLAQMKN